MNFGGVGKTQKIFREKREMGGLYPIIMVPLAKTHSCNIGA